MGRSSQGGHEVLERTTLAARENDDWVDLDAVLVGSTAVVRLDRQLGVFPFG